MDIGVESSHRAERHLCTRAIEKINASERDVVPVLGQDFGGVCACGFNRPGYRWLDAEFPERLEPSSANDLLCRFGTWAKDAVDRAVGRHQRTERKSDVHLLERQTSGEEHEQILGPRRFAGRVNVLEHRADRVPDLAPALAARTPQKARMLRFAEE